MAGLATALAVGVLLATLLGLGLQDALVVRAAGAGRAAAADANPNAATVTPTLLVATSASYWPMEYISDTHIVGHDIDLMNAIAAAMEVTAVYIDVPWESVLDGLIAGQHDAVISTLSVTPVREAVVDFTLPYVMFRGNDNIAIAVQQGNDVLRHRFNQALRQLRAHGTLEAIVAAIAADVPEWEPQLPHWPRIFLPLVSRASD